MARKCQKPDGDVLKGTLLECQKIAVTARVLHRWVAGNGFVKERASLCRTCADLVGEARAEQEFERRAS